MNFGFGFGSVEYNIIDETGWTLTSISGFNFYLLIIDWSIQHTWVFLSSSKAPPCNLVMDFLQKHGNLRTPKNSIWMDEGDELWGSKLFHQTVMSAGYLLEPTAAAVPFQMDKLNIQIKDIFWRSSVIQTFLKHQHFQLLNVQNPVLAALVHRKPPGPPFVQPCKNVTEYPTFKWHGHIYWNAI